LKAQHIRQENKDPYKYSVTGSGATQGPQSALENNPNNSAHHDIVMEKVTRNDKPGHDRESNNNSAAV
jgi:hypothetical protein